LNSLDWWHILLKINPCQITRLEDERADSFARQLSLRARARHPQAMTQWSEDDLTAYLRQEVNAARAHGVTSREEMERWADIACILGFGFAEAQQWAARLLAQDRPPAQKLGMLEETAAFAAREI
jgi:hypothetical protein